MARALEDEVTIDKPVEAVWSVLTDWEQAPRWMSGVDTLAADGGVEVGTNLRFHARGKERPAEIVGVEQGRSVTLRSVQGGVTADYTYVLSDVGDERTRAALTAECRTNGAFWTLVGPLVRAAMRRADGGQMRALKSLVEGRP